MNYKTPPEVLLNKRLSVKIAVPVPTRTFIKLYLYNTYYIYYVQPLISEMTTFWNTPPVYERECSEIVAKLEIDARLIG